MNRSIVTTTGCYDHTSVNLRTTNFPHGTLGKPDAQIPLTQMGSEGRPMTGVNQRAFSKSPDIQQLLQAHTHPLASLPPLHVSV